MRNTSVYGTGTGRSVREREDADEQKGKKKPRRGKNVLSITFLTPDLILSKA